MHDLDTTYAPELAKSIKALEGWLIAYWAFAFGPKGRHPFAILFLGRLAHLRESVTEWDRTPTVINAMTNDLDTILGLAVYRAAHWSEYNERA